MHYYKLTDLISLNDARENKIINLRKLNWSNKHDHIQIHITDDGLFGPWVKLYSPMNDLLFNENPHIIGMISQFDLNAKEYLPWCGPFE